ncbi:HAD family hydrolase [Aminipila luticellarii]|uniref:Uncharacterized protein n=1 Tax=Aminipila luticellarii TaxID=2507160 RepID=A0A410PSQ0_9FIRM|nr:hypothetical protein [Aminipila luticellarii]QAT41919.1 hypothetical protein EQM06_01020 [Aminipila luticellarii]
MVEYNTKDIYKAIDAAELVSFDIFDTLLIRPFARPTDLFWYMEKFFDISGFAKERIEQEHLCRIELHEKEEITFERIYDRIPKYRELADCELGTELKLSLPNAELLKIYLYAQEKNKRIVLISDMYLPEPTICQMLKKNGYNNYDKLYLSCTVGLTKSTGNLYQYMLEDQKILAGSVVHIGDNYESDFLMPRQLGMKSCYYPKLIDRYFNQNSQMEILLNEHIGDISFSAVVMQLAKRFAQGYTSYWERFGYEYGGPVIWAYMKWLEERLTTEHNDITDIFFVARDGYLLKKAFEKITVNHDISTHYVYAPRLLFLICGLKEDKTPEDWAILMNYYRDELNLDRGTVLTDNIIESKKELLEKFCKREKDNYQKYLKTLIKTTEPHIAVVDTATEAYSSQRLLDAVLNRRTQGFWWIKLHKARVNFPNYLADSFSTVEWHDIKNWDLMELIMTAPELPIVTVRNNTPVYKEADDRDKKRIEIFSSLAPSALKFVDDILSNPATDLLKLDSSNLADWINSFLENPSREDVDAFRSVYHAYDPGHSLYRNVIPLWYNDELKMQYPVRLGKLEKIKTCLSLLKNDRATLKHRVKSVYAGKPRLLVAMGNLYRFLRSIKNAVLMSRKGCSQMLIMLKSYLPASSRSFHGRMNNLDGQLAEIQRWFVEERQVNEEKRQIFEKNGRDLEKLQLRLGEISDTQLKLTQQISELYLQIVQLLSGIQSKSAQQISEIHSEIQTKLEQQILELSPSLERSQKSLDRMESALSTINYEQLIRGMQWCMSTATLHRESFLQYKNKYAGKTVVLCGAAHSLNYYDPIEGAVHVALNRAFLYDKVNFDYIFVQDFEGIAHVTEELKQYKGNNCVKFFGTQNGWNGKEIPVTYAEQCRAIRFNTDLFGINNNLTHSELAYDIATYPLGNFFSIAFPALQFVLYTNPAKVYLVGNDFAPTGYFTNLNSTREQIEHEDDDKIKYWSHDYIWGFWIKFYDFAKAYYPDTEFISVNPVALKGLFRDEYTECYLKDHPETVHNSKENH